MFLLLQLNKLEQVRNINSRFIFTRTTSSQVTKWRWLSWCDVSDQISCCTELTCCATQRNIATFFATPSLCIVHHASSSVVANW